MLDHCRRVISPCSAGSDRAISSQPIIPLPDKDAPIGQYIRNLPRRSGTDGGREKKSVRFAETAGRGLAGAAVLLNLIADFLAVSEGRQARAFNGGDVDENVLTAIVGLNESKARGAIESLAGSGRHMHIPSSVCSAFDPAVKPDRF